MVQPIGKAADLLCQFFCQGIADLFESRAIMGRAPPGVPQEEFGRCYDQMNAVTVNADSPGAAGEIRLMGVPPVCMNPANVLVGDPVNGPYALPCGSDCLHYTGLNEQQFNELSDKLHAAAS